MEKENEEKNYTVLAFYPSMAMPDFPIEPLHLFIYCRNNILHSVAQLALKGRLSDGKIYTKLKTELSKNLRLLIRLCACNKI